MSAIRFGVWAGAARVGCCGAVVALLLGCAACANGSSDNTLASPDENEFWMMQGTVRQVGGIQLGFYGVREEDGHRVVRVVARPDPDIYGGGGDPAPPELSVPVGEQFCVEDIGCIEVVDAEQPSRLGTGPAADGIAGGGPRASFQFCPGNGRAQP